jgi:catechol 2,3-dioxygenase-like lactoylglutathione lyase family enzyme
MTTLNYLLLAAANPKKSGELYRKLLGLDPVENSETFVLFVLPSGLKLGLWLAGEMEPKVGKADGVDISFAEPNYAAVRSTYEEWKDLDLVMLQEPTEMDFGFTFTAADPDGHRLRVFAMNENPR